MYAHTGAVMKQSLKNIDSMLNWINTKNYINSNFFCIGIIKQIHVKYPIEGVSKIRLPLLEGDWNLADSLKVYVIIVH